MKQRFWILILLWSCGLGMRLNAQEDFLTSQEISSLRDEQDPDKRIILYLEFAQRRLDAVKQALTSSKADRGRVAQKNLQEYNSVLEALETTIEDARQKRGLVEKTLKEVEKRGVESLRYLQSLQSGPSSSLSDYQYTLEEAIEMTRDDLAEVKKGTFPEIKERTPPAMPAAPPPDSKRSGGEEGPPRKKR